MEICCQSYKNIDTICQCQCSQQLIAVNLRSLRWHSKQAVLTCSPWNAMLTCVKDYVNTKTKIGRMIMIIYIKAGMPLPIPASWVYWHEGKEAYWPPRPALLASAHIANLVFYCLWCAINNIFNMLFQSTLVSPPDIEPLKLVNLCTKNPDSSFKVSCQLRRVWGWEIENQGSRPTNT